jgi:branched-chain amino acid transport system permease protein
MENLFTILFIGLWLGGIYGLVSIGLTLIFGVIRITNFAHGEVLMVGMYGTYLAYSWLGLNPYLAVVVVVPVMFVFGVLIQRVLMQPLLDEPLMQMFASFGLLMFLQNLVLMLTRGASLGIPSSGRTDSLSIAGINLSLGHVLAFVASTVIVIALHFFLRHTMMGKAIRAVTQDKRAAATMGINVNRIYRLTFGLGTAITGMASVFLTPIYTLSPSIGGDFVLAAFAVVVLGGMGSIWGAYFAGLIIGVTEAAAGFYIDPALKSAVWFLIFIIVLIVRPSGLLGTVGAEEVGLREQH